jgi:hypothetical protein
MYNINLGQTFSHVIYLELARLIVSWQWVTEVLVVPSSLGCPASRRLFPTLPARRNTLLSVNPAMKHFGYTSSSMKYTFSNLVLPSSYVTTTVPRPFHQTLLTIPRANILTFIIILFVSTLTTDPLPFGMSPVMTMSSTSSLKCYHVLISLTFGPSLDFSDACARRSLPGWRFNF